MQPECASVEPRKGQQSSDGNTSLRASDRHLASVHDLWRIDHPLRGSKLRDGSRCKARDVSPFVRTPIQALERLCSYYSNRNDSSGKVVNRFLRLLARKRKIGRRGVRSPVGSVSPSALSQGAARPDNRGWSARRKLYPEASQRVVSNDPNDLHGC